MKAAATILLAVAGTLTWAQSLPAIQMDGALMLDHEQLRAFRVARAPDQVTTYGALAIEIRKAVMHADTGLVSTAGSVAVKYRNRLIAAATGYRLGAFPTNNGVVIEHWDGNATCVFTRWQLKFAGERLVLDDDATLRDQNCRERK